MSEERPGECGPLVEGETFASECLGAEAEPIAAATLQSELLNNLALDENRQQLNALVGQYACGTSPFFRGTSTWQDANADPEADSLDGPVIAALVDDDHFYGFDGDQTGPHLIVSSPTEDLHAFATPSLEQPGATEFTRVSGSLQAQGVRFLCSDCFPDLPDLPPTFSYDVVAASDFPGSDSAIEAQGMLEEVEPSDIQWSELEALNRFRSTFWGEALSEFTTCGGVLVRDVDATYLEEAPQVPSAQGSCYYGVNYTARWWVDVSNLARHGVADFEVTEVSYCCGGGQGSEQECFPVDG